MDPTNRFPRFCWGYIADDKLVELAIQWGRTGCRKSYDGHLGNTKFYSRTILFHYTWKTYIGNGFSRDLSTSYTFCNFCDEKITVNYTLLEQNEYS